MALAQRAMSILVCGKSIDVVARIFFGVVVVRTETKRLGQEHLDTSYVLTCGWTFGDRSKSFNRFGNLVGCFTQMQPQNIHVWHFTRFDLSGESNRSSQAAAALMLEGSSVAGKCGISTCHLLP